ncbi:MAG: amino acid adenylation domain-containing protein, partial [bacterium]|nr:amino acid adenylation domain-containing protein [bacterium]
PSTKSTKTTQLTYRELNKKSNQLAAHIIQRGVTPGTIVAIMVERSLEIVIAILGILKAGGAYLPIEPQYPTERIDYMLKDSSARLVLVEDKTENRISKTETKPNNQNSKDQNSNDQNQVKEPEVLNLKHLRFEIDSEFGIPASDLDIEATGIAYVIYTSGTTGRPKGVLVEHRGLVSLNTEFANNFKITTRDKIIQFANICFDASVWEIFMALLNGAELDLIRKEIINDYQLFHEYLEKNQITVATLPPPYANNLEIEKINTIRILITAGSSAKPEFARACGKRFQYINAYGPTEDTICSSYWIRRETEPVGRRTVSIGKPVNNTGIYIVDENMTLQPIGGVGELCTAGAGTARGYLNNPELTSEKFVNYKIPNNQYQITNNKLYRTGDLARWRPDGNLEYLGRIDNQVKLRGFRIELGEIENRLLTHEEIKETVVIDRTETKNEETYLCAYIVVTQHGDTDIEGRTRTAELREYLAQTLPDYMIPSYFIELEKIPLNTNGKIDRKALTQYPITNNQTRTSIAPRNKIEEKLNEIWANILGVKKQEISMEDDFFHIGGHSLRATVMAARIHKEFNVKLPLPEIFKKSTIEALADSINNNKLREQDKYYAIEPGEKKEYYSLSSAQKRLYILQQMEAKSIVYNMPQIIPLAKDTDPERLETVFRKLIRRHESLRTTFHMIPVTPNNQTPLTNNTIPPDTPGEIIPVQKVHDDPALVEFEIDNYKPGDRQSFFRPFDLSKAPLLRVGIVENTGIDAIGKATHERYMMLDMHHIITDGRSQEILTREFFELFDGGRLEPLRLQYRDYARWQNSPEQKELIKQQEEYWLNRFTGELPVLNLPTDYPRPVNQRFEGSKITFEINKEKTGRLKKTAKENETTLYMIILAIFTILLAKLSGQQEIIVGTPTAGRRHAELENIIGMFVNTLAMRNTPGAGETFREYLLKVKEN